MFHPREGSSLRVARRYSKTQGYAKSDSRDIFLELPVPAPAISDDVAVQCSNGCVIASRDVEESIAQTVQVEPKSCQFSEVHANDEANRVRFQVRKLNGAVLEGTVSVNVVASRDRLTAFSIIELDGEGARVSDIG